MDRFAKVYKFGIFAKFAHVRKSVHIHALTHVWKKNAQYAPGWGLVQNLLQYMHILHIRK